jgi:hypothetical protein
MVLSKTFWIVSVLAFLIVWVEEHHTASGSGSDSLTT